jgi:hypothetical protein
MSQQQQASSRLEDVFAAFDRRYGGRGFIPFAAADEALTAIGLDTSHGTVKTSPVLNVDASQ